MPHITFDFYKAKIASETQANITHLLEDTMFSKSLEVDGSNCCITDKHSKDSISSFLITKIRMNMLPAKTKINGTRTNLDLDEDEGLGEDVAIAYSQDLQVFAIQRNRYSLSATSICKLINACDPTLKLQLYPILTPDSIEKFYSMDKLTKARIRFAGVENFNFLQDTSFSTSQKLNIQDLLNEPSVELVLSVGRTRGALSENVRNFISKLLESIKNKESDNLNCLQVTGKEIDGEKTILDLLENRLIYTCEVQTLNRVVDTQQLLKEACVGILENYKRITEYYA